MYKLISRTPSSLLRVVYEDDVCDVGEDQKQPQAAGEYLFYID